MPHRHLLHRIQQLDPERDHQEIVRLSNVYEFPWDTQRALEFALFRTYAVPSISGLLHQTGEFYTRTQKRYDDTGIIISLLYAYGYDSERGRAALRNMNRQHGRYAIGNDDFLYVMSTFVYEPPRWLKRFGWRPMSEHEQLALFHFWRALGRRMNLQHLPTDYAAFEQFNCDYEAQHFAYAPSNQAVGAATVDLMLSWYLPRPLFALGRPAVYALLDAPLRRAFGFPTPPAWLTAAAEAALRLRARALRALTGDRTQPRVLADLPSRTYPRGYAIDDLGPPTTEGTE